MNKPMLQGYRSIIIQGRDNAINIGSIHKSPTSTSYTCKPIHKHNLSIFRLYSIQLTGFNIIDACLDALVHKGAASRDRSRSSRSMDRRALRNITRAMISINEMQQYIPQGAYEEMPKKMPHNARKQFF